ncbi:unnamed protein product, partial [Ixodes hexagonus]
VSSSPEPVCVADEEPEFHWEDYLEATQSEAVPATAFAHVEQSLESGLRPGMKLEVLSEDGPSYWLATVVTTCGPLLSLRYLGADRSADFWCDLGANEVHPLGWCAQHQKPLRPPQAVRDRHLDWEKLLDQELKGAVTVPAYVLEMKGSVPIDQLREGMKLLVLEEGNPLNGWAASVRQNVGGRLLLRYDGCQEGTWDLWLFYLSHRVRPLDAPSHGDQTYRPPQCIEKLHSLDKWKQILKDSMAQAQSYNTKILANILQPPVALREHSFQVGQKVELLHPVSRQQACPATITATLAGGHWFLVQVDDLRHPKEGAPLVRCCHAGSQSLLPPGWAQRNGLPLLPPPGYPCGSFDWEEYLRSCGAQAAPSSCFHLEEDSLGFEPGQKLEVVNVHRPNEVCVGGVERVCPPLVWLRLEPGGETLVVPLRSHQLFPVGWCASNSFPLRAPRDYQRPPPPSSSSSAQQADRWVGHPPVVSLVNAEGGASAGRSSWCPCIFLNHRCFSGPFLSKGRLAELPRQIGPGPVALVLKEVLSQVISVAYKSTRVLSELQLRGAPNPKMQQQLLKAKFRGRTYRAVVETVRCSSQLESFCRSVCAKLQCCPNLFGPRCYGDEGCPEKCSSLTKTRYAYQFVRKRHRRHLALRKPKQPEEDGAPSTLVSTPFPLRSAGCASRPGRSQAGSQYPQTHTHSQTYSTPCCHYCATYGCSLILKLRAATNLQQQQQPQPQPQLRQQPQPQPQLRQQPQRQQQQGTSGDEDSPGECAPVRTTKAPVGRPRKRPLPSCPASPRESSESVRQPQVGAPSSELGPPSLSNIRGHFRHMPKHRDSQTQPDTLTSNPLEWSVADVANYVRNTPCSYVARRLHEQEIDGQALLLLTLPMVQEFLDLQGGPAVQFCQLLERLKLAFYLQYAPK